MATSTRQRHPSQARQAEIVQTVLRLAAEQTPDSITTQDIARAIGVTQGAIFRHFPSKDAIWIAATEWMATTFLRQTEEAAESESNPLTSLQAVFMAHVGFAADHPGVPRLIFHELQQPADSAVKQRVREMLVTYRGLIVRLLTVARSQGMVDPRVDMASAATLLVGTVQGLIMQSMFAGDTSGMRAAGEKLFRIYLRGIRETP